MAATLLARRLDRQSVTITVVESSDIRTVGVGEATVPGIRDFFREIGVTEQEVMAAAQGTVKLGIEFVDWKREGSGSSIPSACMGCDRGGGVPPLLAQDERSWASYAAVRLLSRNRACRA
ncbi:tryptophan 7-halogenase [Sphingomonas sp. 22L2VL55-3]